MGSEKMVYVAVSFNPESRLRAFQRELTLYYLLVIFYPKENSYPIAERTEKRPDRKCISAVALIHEYGCWESSMHASV